MLTLVAANHMLRASDHDLVITNHDSDQALFSTKRVNLPCGDSV